MKRKRIYGVLAAGILSLAAVGAGGISALAASGEAETETENSAEAIDSTEATDDAKAADDSSGSDGEAQDAAEETSDLGEFTTEDINGETYTQEMFQDYDLTMVNVFATWCGPCVNEIPHLQKLYEEMKEEGVNIVGILLDGVEASGETDEAAIQTAKLLAELTGATYPFLLPDATNLNGRLEEIYAIPETFFVDSEGNIVGETYTGSASYDDWKERVLAELEALENADS